jgi:hypothetical protein
VTFLAGATSANLPLGARADAARPFEATAITV